jgi:hypothetical protein
MAYLLYANHFSSGFPFFTEVWNQAPLLHSMDPAHSNSTNTTNASAVTTSADTTAADTTATSADTTATSSPSVNYVDTILYKANGRLPGPDHVSSHIFYSRLFRYWGEELGRKAPNATLAAYEIDFMKE